MAATHGSCTLTRSCEQTWKYGTDIVPIAVRSSRKIIKCACGIITCLMHENKTTVFGSTYLDGEFNIFDSPKSHHQDRKPPFLAVLRG